jgi:hypothetical protein
LKKTLARRLMTLDRNRMATATILDEPMLLFGGSYPAVDPKLGISLYGPYSTEKTIKIGIIGDKDTTSQVHTILENLKHPVEGPTRHPTWTQGFPGVSPDSPFQCELQTSDKWWQTITSKDVEPLDKFYYVKQRISLAVDVFYKYIQNLKDREGSLGVVICAPPKRMMDLCITAEESRLKRRFTRGREQGNRKRGSFAPSQTYLTDFVAEIKEDQYQQVFQRTADNFHHFLKAKTMGLGIPTQLILPYTLNTYTLPDQKPMQDPATFAWNLSVALLYKAGGRPWRPEKIPTGTCFVGISFYRERRVYGGQMGTSVAQVFTPEGEGLVLKGERFSWAFHKSPNLGRDSAKRLLEKALALYNQHTQVKPSRVVVHKSSKYTDEELKGFEEALADIHQRDFLTIARKEKRIRFFRLGYNPIIRGTKIAFPDGTWLLYTKAYIPFLRVYPGPRVPLPIEIIQHIGDTPPETLSEEILMLTKLNVNSADFCSHLPITLEFSRKVGSILKELPPGITPQNKYLFYM